MSMKPANQTRLKTAYAAYLRQVDQQELSHTMADLKPSYFQTNSRDEQLETLAHLSQFSDHLVLITGPSGAGKTTFIERFVAAQPAHFCVAYLSLSEPATKAWVAELLVSQLSVQVDVDASHEDKIIAIQSLAQDLAIRTEKLLIVVDNALWLDDEALDLLANIMVSSPSPEKRPHVILCAEDAMMDRIETPKFSILRNERFYHLVLAPFSASESASYLRQLLIDQGVKHALTPMHLLQLHQLAHGHPGYLNMLANKALSKGRRASKSGLPWLHILATSIVVIILLAVWITNQGLTKSQSVLTSQLMGMDLEAEEMGSTGSFADLPPLPTLLPPLEMIELSPASENVTFEPGIELKEIANTDKNADAERANTAISEAKLMLTTDASSLLSKEGWPLMTKLQKQPYHFDDLLGLPKDHYTLQVMGAGMETTIEAFVAENEFEEPYFAIQLQRDGKPWHLLFVGSYGSANEAITAVSGMNLALQNQRPWARPVASIQQQIRKKFNTSGE